MAELNTSFRSLPVIEHTKSVYKVWFAHRDHFPKKSKYTLGDRIDSRFILVLELLSAAAYQGVQEKVSTLERALTNIDTLKFLIQLCWELKLFNTEKYTEISTGLVEIGRQVGAWKKGLQNQTPAG